VKDWTRYAKTPNAALFGQAITAPVTICVTALCGILIASASTLIYGQVFWNPFLLLLHAQTAMTPASRAGTFFAGMGLLASQIALCIVLNSVPAGMDMTTICPQYINIRRGAYIVMIVGIAICPWNYVTRATTFITYGCLSRCYFDSTFSTSCLPHRRVISGWGIFLAPMTGIVIADYFVVHRRELHLDDLYIGNHTSAYWYTAGFNWRAPVAWYANVPPPLPLSPPLCH
jgi:nucleobase:cation symporter-1, NCS1 family